MANLIRPSDFKSRVHDSKRNLGRNAFRSLRMRGGDCRRSPHSHGTGGSAVTIAVSASPPAVGPSTGPVANSGGERQWCGIWIGRAKRNDSWAVDTSHRRIVGRSGILEYRLNARIKAGSEANGLAIDHVGDHILCRDRSAAGVLFALSSWQNVWLIASWCHYGLLGVLIALVIHLNRKLH